MIEVFKTDVNTPDQANKVLDAIRASFAGHDGNFDLEDCDHILRVTSSSSTICPQLVIDLLAAIGHHSEVLADEYESMQEVLQAP